MGKMAERKVQRLGANGREFVTGTFRFPPSLYEALRASAKDSGRTMNAELVQRLAAGFGEGFEVPISAERSEPSDVARMAEDIRAIREFVESFARGAA